MASLLGLQLRNGRLDGGQSCLGTHHIQLVAHARIAQLRGHVLRTLLIFQVVAGNGFTQLCAAQLTVGVDHLGNQRDLQLIEVGLCSVLIGIAGFQLALYTSEQVHFPGHVQAQVIALAVDPALGDAGLLTLADVAAGAAGHHWHHIVGDVIANGARRLEPGEGDAQIAVAVQ